MPNHPNTAPLQIPVRNAVIGKNTQIKRALPNRNKRTIGAWCFLDHVGPVHFESGAGLDVGPHPHTGLHTFTWMIEGEVMHTDSLGYKQLISPNQINLMTAGNGISHTEVTPKDFKGKMHSVQLWIAQPESTRHGQANFEHYPHVPKLAQNGFEYSILVGDFLGTASPVKVATPLVGVDIKALHAAQTTLPLKPDFEYGILLLEGAARINGQEMDVEQFLYFDTGESSIEIDLDDQARIILIGGEPFEAPILLWWNLVARNKEEIEESVKQWLAKDARFGHVADYPGERLTPPEIPANLIASK